MPSSKRSMRGQLLLQATNAAIMSAAQDDYLNAVTAMESAAAISECKLPPRPFGVPDIVRGDSWKAYRNFYHSHFPRVYRHVNEVLKSLSESSIGVEGKGGDDDE